MGEDFTPLSHEILGKCLANIERTVDGSGYAFTKLDCSGKDITDLGNKVAEYEHLRHAVVSNNKITDLTQLSKLPHLLSLNASSNAVENLECMKDGVLPWCQILDVSANRLGSLASLESLGRLRVLHLHGNAIESLEGFGGHPFIESMQLQQNQLTTLEGFGTMPKLTKLNISENQLTDLTGIDCPILDSLDASKNQIASLEGAGGVPEVITLNLTGNQLQGDEDMLEVRKLNTDVLPKLEDLMLDGNPMVEAFGDNYRAEIVICIPTVPKIDGAEVTAEEREQAANMEKAREEEKAAAAAAAEAGDGAEDA